MSLILIMSNIISTIFLLWIIFDEMKNDIEKQLKTGHYICMMIFCIIPILSILLATACIILILIEFLSEKIDKYRGKLKEKHDNDAVKYQKLTKLLLDAEMFSNYSQIEDFIEAGDICNKLSSN